MGSDISYGLAGRRAIVTGHRGGIGSAIFDTLSRDGVEVIGLDLPDFDLSDTASLEHRLTAARRRTRTHRHPGQQCRRHGAGHGRGNVAGRNRAGVPRQFPGCLRPDARRPAGHAAAPARRDRQHRIRPGADRQAGQRGVWRLQGRHRSAIPVRRAGLGAVRHQGELRCAGQHRHRHAGDRDRRPVGEISGPVSGFLGRRLQVGRAAGPVRATRRRSPPRSHSWLRMPLPSSPALCCRWTAAAPRNEAGGGDRAEPGASAERSPTGWRARAGMC